MSDGADLVVNCLGPALFDNAFDLALTCGADYTDLLSQPTDAHKVRAQKAGIVAVPNQGLSPGLSNILAAHAAGAMTRMDKLEIAYVLERSVAPTPAMLDTLVWGFSRMTDGRGFFQDGRFVPAGPREGSQLVEFPEPFGERLAFFRPHPESTSLPVSIPTLKYCAVRAAYPAEVQSDMWTLDKYGLLNPDVAEAVKRAIYARFGGRTVGPSEGRMAMVVQAEGERNGRRLGRRYELVTTYAHTGICAGIGAGLIARHGAATPGVVEPERYFNPAEFLAALGEAGVAVAWTDTELELDASGDPR